VPLWEDVSIYEKMNREGEMDKYLSGGSIAHIQIGSEITPSQKKKLVKYAVKAGLEHFALNAVYSKCENPECGNVQKADFDKCPECGETNVTKFTRVVGFFTPVSSWNAVRREWEFPRRKFVDINVK
jgi:ribonucleoside-triphosphate reductase